MCFLYNGFNKKKLSVRKYNKTVINPEPVNPNNFKEESDQSVMNTKCIPKVYQRRPKYNIINHSFVH